MKKTKNFLKNNYHVLLLILMFGSVLYLVFHNNFWGDDYRYYRVALCDFKEILQFLKWHMQNYNGRTLVHFLVILSLRNQFTVNLWRVCSAIVMCLISVIIAKISSDNKTDFKICCAMSTLMIIATKPYFWNTIVYWQTGWFNYIFPSLMLLILMVIYRKNPKSFWIFPLSLICGATTEQIGLMSIGFFVLLIAQYAIENKKFNVRMFVGFILSAAGFLTVALSHGTYSRVSDQGGIPLSGMLINLITVLRERWIDNTCIFLLTLAINFFVVYWLIKFKKNNRFTSKVNLPLGIAVSAGTLVSYGIKTVLTLFDKFGREIEFSALLNECIFVLWIIYASLFILSFFYTTLLIYLFNKESFPLIAFVLGAGSQLMLILAEASMNRTCTAAFFMFTIFVVYSLRFFVSDVRQSENEKVKKYFKTEVIVTAFCICACMAQVATGMQALLPNNDHMSQEQFPLVKMNSEELKRYTDALEKNRQEVFSGSAWVEDFDIKDFTWLS